MLNIDGGTIITHIHTVRRIFDNRAKGAWRSYNANLPHHELVYMRSGRSTMTLNGVDYAYEPGSIIYLPQMDHHEYHVVTIEPGECIDIYFHIDKPLADAPALLPGPHRQDIADLFARCDEEWLSGSSSRELRVKGSLFEILALLLEEADARTLTKKAQKAFDCALQYLTRHCFEPRIDYQGVAALSGVSYSYMKRLFLERMGMPPTVFVLHLRLDRARDLLLATTDSVSEIALACGFGSVYYFSRIFRREMGISPTAYRATMT